MPHITNEERKLSLSSRHSSRLTQKSTGMSSVAQKQGTHNLGEIVQRISQPSTSIQPTEILHLQRAIGNRVTSNLLTQRQSMPTSGEMIQRAHKNGGNHHISHQTKHSVIQRDEKDNEKDDEMDEEFDKMEQKSQQNQLSQQGGWGGLSCAQ